MLLFELFIKVFGGLGLFLIGIHLFTHHVKKFSGVYIRRYVDKYTGTRLQSFVLGFVAGAISTSAKFVTFTAAGLIVSGVITPVTASFISAGSSIGTISLIIGATFDINKLLLVVLGISGLSIQFSSSRSEKINTISNVLVGFGLLFLGIEIMKEGARPIRDLQLFTEFIGSSQQYLIPALLISAIIAMVTQSETTAAVFGFTMIDAGLLNIDQSIMYVYGSCIGVGISTLLLSYGFKGRLRQGGVFNAILKIIGATLLIPLLYIEIYYSFPIIKTYMNMIPFSFEVKIAMVFLLYKIVSVLLWLMFYGPIRSLIVKYIAISQEEDYSILKYISSLNIDDIVGSLELIKKEQIRLFERTPQYLDVVRHEVPVNEKVDYKALHEANKTIDSEIDYYIADLFIMNLNKEQSKELLYIHNLQELTDSLNTNLYKFVDTIRRVDRTKEVKGFCDIFIEGIHAALLTATDVIRSMDGTDVDILMQITRDKGEIVENLKKDYLIEALNIPKQNQNIMLDLLVYYDRIEWLLNRIAVITNSYVTIETANESG